MPETRVVSDAVAPSSTASLKQDACPFWRGAVTDPRTCRASSTRIAGLLAIAAACFVAIAGVLMHQEFATTVSALVVGGAVPFLTRAKAQGGTGEAH